MTREEYKRNLIRMFDSIRNEYKGDENCAGVDCGDNCPFYMKVCCIGQVKFHAYEAIEIVEQWAKEHPIVTNAEKFKEVFGIGDIEGMCVCRDRCEYCKYYIPDDKDCGVQAKFWNAEYNGGEEE